MTESSIVDKIDAILPQTQCTKCGFDGCRPYAEAIASEAAAHNRCPPGGVAGVHALAKHLGRDPLPLDPDCGTVPQQLHVAAIDEVHCIGCTLCIQACPVDAIVGANKLMHTVIPDLCTGCELCVAPCPVDCIDMVPAGREWTQSDADAARHRHQERASRLKQVHEEPASAVARNLLHKAPVATVPSDQGNKQKLIADVLAKARARRRSSTDMSQ